MGREAGTRTAVLLTALVSAAFLAALLHATAGRAVPPVADLYVVCQYARMLAEGHPFRYHAGEPATSGATSLLHTAWLALGWRAGFRGESLVGFAIASGAGLFALTAALATRLAARLSGDGAGLLAGALVALGGPVAWGFLYGSDIALFLFLATWLFERLVATWGAPASGSAVTAAVLLSVARPEGLPIGLALALVWLARGGGPLSLLPAAAGAAVRGLERVLTGSWLPSSAADKSLFAAYGADGALALLSEYVVDVVRGLLLGFYPSQAPLGLARGWASLCFPPLGLLFVIAALLRCGTPVRLWAGLIAGVWMLGAPNLFLGVHFNRYLLWAFPSLLVLVAVGARRWLEPRLFRACAATFLVLGGASTLRFALLYGEMAGSLARRELEAARFITDHVPERARVANVATSVDYLTGRPGLNLHGVTSAAFFGGRAAEREASMLEALARLPPEDRPPYLLSSERAQESQPTLQALAAGAPLFRTASLSDDELLLFETRFDAFEAAPSPRLPTVLEAVAGLEPVDSLNVGDPPDERRHDYRAHGDLGALRVAAGARVAGLPWGERLADAGRAVLGSESFVLSHAPGRDLVLVLRTAPDLQVALWRPGGVTRHELGFAKLKLAFEANGRPVGELAVEPQPGWHEAALRVPAAALGEGRTRLRVRGRFASFRYWAFQ
jgi:hypothetical protein